MKGEFILVLSQKNLKHNFLKDFQSRVVQGRRLLQTGNHRWADKLFNDLLLEIENNTQLNVQKKHQLILVLSNSWWMYIKSLKNAIKKNERVDLIKLVDAYKRFFAFLAKLDDFYYFDAFASELLNSFIKMKEISLEGITRYINSFCSIINERGLQLKLMELQLLLIYLRKSIFPQKFFHLTMEQIGKILYKLDPAKRTLILIVFLENINFKYNLEEKSSDFINLMNKLMLNRIPDYLKDEFRNLSRITINNRTYKNILSDLDELILYLNNIGEFSWIIIIIKSIFSYINKFESFGDAITYIRRFIDFFLVRNRFEIVFEIYDFLEDLFMDQTSLDYDNVLIELWIEACKKFTEMKEKKYLLKTLEKLNQHLKNPKTEAQIFHYLYTHDYLWQFKSAFFSSERIDFWRMIFYRALYEEQDFELANKIKPFLGEKLKSMIHDVKELYLQTKDLMNSIYSFEDDVNIINEMEDSFEIMKLVIRINHKRLISYRMISKASEIKEGKILNEYWNDQHIKAIFNDLFSTEEEKKFNLSLNDFGKIFYIFLPKALRNILKQIRIKSIGFVPEIYFILDQMTIPFELIYDNNFFLLKYSIGYIMGDPPLGGILFDESSQQIDMKELDSQEKRYNAMIIECVNSKWPLKWNEKLKKNELVFPFEDGLKELYYITEFFSNRKEVERLAIFSDERAKKEDIIDQLKNGENNIIHFVGNIFYSNQNPQNSYFLTNDKKILTFKEINMAINENKNNLRPLIFLNSQIYDVKGKKLNNILDIFGEIAEQFNQNNIMGIIARNNPVFDAETQELTANFYINLFKGNSQGISLLKARQECMAKKMTKLIEQEFNELSADEGIKNIDVQNSLAISSYMLFGKPWRKLK